MIGALILGLVAGALARAILPGKQDINILWTIALGLAGASVGYLIFNRLLGIGDDDIFDLGGLLGAVIGSVILLYAYERLIVERRHTPRSGDAI
jgi:uncharacterized membrane protein YeaQ/YmgE (transglycosylase-associated protein family)